MDLYNINVERGRLFCEKWVGVFGQEAVDFFSCVLYSSVMLGTKQNTCLFSVCANR